MAESGYEGPKTDFYPPGTKLIVKVMRPIGGPQTAVQIHDEAKHFWVVEQNPERVGQILNAMGRLHTVYLHAEITPNGLSLGKPVREVLAW